MSAHGPPFVWVRILISSSIRASDFNLITSVSVLFQILSHSEGLKLSTYKFGEHHPTHNTWCLIQFSSVTQSCLTLQPHGLQHTRLPCPSSTPRACSNSCPSSQWCHPTISSSAVPFSSCLQSFQASQSFPMSQFFPSGGQIIDVWASASVLPMNIQGWFPLGLTGLISLQSKGLLRVFSSSTVQKHQFFGTQLSL